ncbi:MAG TPA: dockerin type I domain-containing protein, partial [bacterium]|nr:dockerin type I domain-containing protein [bacterium]
PSDGASLNSYELVQFQGAGQDFEDGILSGDSLVWSSDVDGVLGSGVSVESNALSPGTHHITLQVFDSALKSATQMITVTVDESLVLVADIHRDGKINDLDMIKLASYWQTTPEAAKWDAKVDLNQDQAVDAQDALLLIEAIVAESGY